MTMKFFCRFLALLVIVLCISFIVTMTRDGGLEVKHGIDYFFTLVGIISPGIVAVFAGAWFIGSME